jgi:nitrite reductase/ring-hydroxylating ferredoxin subunit
VTTPTLTPKPLLLRPAASFASSSSSSTVTATTQPRQDHQQQQPIDWQAHWYAVAFEADVDKEAPFPITVLGQRLVVWWDSNSSTATTSTTTTTGQWRAFADACPHKLALLSEGRIVPATGELECPYHGWRWDGSGQCTAIPQAPAESAATAIGSPRACATAFPCRAAQGIIFVKPTPAKNGTEADDDQSPLPLVPELEEGGQRAWLGDGDVIVGDTWRDIPLDFATTTANIGDASHVPFTHHKSISNRNVRNNYDIELDGPISASGFSGLWRSGPRGGKLGPQRGQFIAPALMRQKIDGGVRGVESMVIAYITPTEPGKCRLLNRNTIAFVSGRGKDGSLARRRPLPAVLASFLPRFAGHLATQIPLEDDQIFLHFAEEELWRRRSRDDSDNQAQYLPSAGADCFERAFRQFLSTFGGGGPFGRPGLDASAALPPRLTRTQLLDRYEQHTINCATCLRALARVRRARAAAGAACAVLALLSVFCAAVAVCGGGGAAVPTPAPSVASSLEGWARGLTGRLLATVVAVAAGVAGGGGSDAAAARAVAAAVAALGAVAARSALGRLEQAFLRGTWPPPRNLDKD